MGVRGAAPIPANVVVRPMQLPVVIGEITKGKCGKFDD